MRAIRFRLLCLLACAALLTFTQTTIAADPAARPTKAGVGININIAKDGAVMVADLVPNGPAARAGVKAGDQITAIDGAAIRGVQDLADKMPGEVGSAVKLTVRRGNKSMDFNLTREMINVAQGGGGVAPPPPGVGGGPGAGPGPGPVAASRRHEYQVTPNTSTILLMPELRDAPPPTWVKPGLRIIAYNAAASIPGGRQVLVQDPNGNLRNVATGQTMALQDNTGGGGHGFGIVDIVAVYPDAVVADVKTYLLMDVNNLITYSGNVGAVTTPSCALDLWIHPAVFAKYLDLNGQGISSYRTPYKAAGKTYNALWRQVVGEGASTFVYDIDSGLGLHTAMSTYTAPSTAIVNGVSQNVGGMTNLAQSTLAGIRQINSPWTKGHLPRVLEGVRQITYEGTQTTFIPGAPVMPARIRSVLTVTGRGDDFIQADRTGVLVIGNAPMDLGKSTVVSGPAQLMPIAIEPTDLTTLRQGQEIDKDPTTQAVTYVSSVGRKGGHDLVTITEEFPGAQGAAEHQRMDATFDAASGLMVGVAYNNPFLHQVTSVTLSGKQ